MEWGQGRDQGLDWGLNSLRINLENTVNRGLDPHCPPSQAGEATLPPTPTPSTSTPTIQAEALVAWDQAEEIIQRNPSFPKRNRNQSCHIAHSPPTPGPTGTGWGATFVY